MFSPSEITTCVDFCISDAQWLSDLTGVHEDLVAVQRICKKVEEDSPKFKTGTGEDVLKLMEDRYLISDLLCAGIVRYMRTHGTGVRAGIPKEWLEELPPAFVKAHNYFKDLRDKMIAHSVNPLEDNQVLAWVKGYGTIEAHVTHVNVSPGRYLPGADDASFLNRLVGALLKRVKQEIESESARLLTVARGIPMDDLCMRSTEELPIPVPSKQAGNGRRPFGK